MIITGVSRLILLQSLTDSTSSGAESHTGQAADSTPGHEWGFFYREDSELLGGGEETRIESEKQGKQTVCLLLTECQL